LSQLLHPPSRKAFSAMVAAQRFSEAGDYPHAAEELEKAVRLSPEYADAHWNLAAQYIRLGQYSRAVEESRRAMEFAKPGPMQLCNLAFAQMQLGRYDEATESARASLRLDSTYAQAHFVLGTLLARDGKTLREALPHLELAARTLPSAAKVLELARKGLGNRIAQNAQ
jgi:tetratricopeptide (TPR) repeat protein